MDDIYYCIFRLLDVGDIYSCLLVDKNYNRMVMNEQIWKNLYFDNFGDYDVTGNYYVSFKGYTMMMYLFKKYRYTDLNFLEFINQKYIHISNDHVSSKLYDIKDISKTLRLFNNLQNLDIYSKVIITGGIFTLTNLQNLILNGTHITIIPTSINAMINLKKLDLSNTGIITIPNELFTLTNLEKLYLSGNGIMIMPSAISSLVNLSLLHFCRNRLKYIPTELFSLTKLKKLYLQSNQIKLLPKEISLLTNLHILYLGNNQITNIPCEITKLKNIKHIDIHNNCVIPYNVSFWLKQIQNK